MSAFKKKPGPLCTDCGKKPPTERYVSVNPMVISSDRCADCFEAWARQVLAVQRALR